MQTVGGFEDLRNLAVKLADHLVDGLLPGWVRILSSHDGVEELAECHLGDLQKSIGNLTDKEVHRKRKS